MTNFQLQYIENKYKPTVDRYNNTLIIIDKLMRDPILSEDKALVRFLEEKQSELKQKRDSIWKQWQTEHRNQEYIDKHD